MLKNVLILPGGQEISSGSAGTGIQTLTLTQRVNVGEELTIGSVCAAMLEAKIYDGGALHLQQGQEVILCKEDAAGVRKQVGIFCLEKPTRAGKNSYQLLGYDRVTRLDRDLTQWLEGLSGWPYRLADFAYMVAKVCGLEISGVFPEYRVEKFTARNVTGRRLLEWLGQATCQFCRANPQGVLEFGWYAPATVAIGEGAADPVTVSLQGSKLLLSGVKAEAQQPLRLEVPAARQKGNALEVLTEQIISVGHTAEDYTVAPVDRVRFAQTDADVGVGYPETGENTYSVVGNGMVSAQSTETQRALAGYVYERLRQSVYTPCTVKAIANTQLQAGQIVTFRGITAYIMSKVQTGQLETLGCTGSYSRNSATLRNETTLKDLSGKVLEVKAEIDGLQVENRKGSQEQAKLALQVDGLSAEISRQSTQQAQVETQLTQLTQSAEALSVSVKQITEQGVSRLENTFGLTIDGSAVRIHRSGSEMVNCLDETGMFVTRGDTQMLRADAQGVLATDVSVRNYLMIGDHARFEDYEADRTACFYL